MTNDQLRRDGQARVLELRTIARQVWADSYLDPASRSELRTVLSALDYVGEAFSNDSGTGAAAKSPNGTDLDPCCLASPPSNVEGGNPDCLESA